MQMRPAKLTAYVVFILLLLVPSTAGFAAFADIEGIWAESAITALEQKGIFQGLWEEEFSPSTSLRHGSPTAPGCRF